MKIYIINIIGCLLLFPFCLQSQKLDSLLSDASNNNPSLKAKYLQFEASLKRVSQANALPDPVVSFGYFISPIETRVGAQRARISLSQQFPWFGTLKAKEAVATSQTEAFYNEFLNEKNELYFKVKKAYYPLYEIKRHVVLMEQYLAILETYKQLAMTSVSTGKASMTDVIRVDIMIEDVTTDIQLLKDKLSPQTISFNRLLNRPDSSLIVLVDSLNILDIEDQYRRDSLLVSNPLLKSIDSKIEATNSMVEVAKKSGLPKMSVGLDYAFITKRTDVDLPDNGKNAIMPMVSMTLPIFRGKYNASVEEAKLIQSSLEYEKENIENKLFSDYEMAWYELEKAQQLDTLYKSQMVKTEQMIDLLYVDYSNSGKDFEEVLRMQQQLLKYQIASATSITKFYIALAQLDYITAKS